jgi:hypothetical protein
MTQEFIPTTVTVREMFAHGDSASYEDSVAAFDRWLAAHDAQIRAEALTLTEDEQKLVVNALYSESYRDKVCSANTITDYDERQAEFRRMHNELSLGLFSMVAEHRKGQKQ